MFLRKSKYKKWGAYHWDWYFKGNQKEYIKHVNTILSIFKQYHMKTTLLDIGCGDGLISWLLSKQGFQVVGVDKDKTAITQAKDKCNTLSSHEKDKISFLNADFIKIKGSFDYVLASEIIEHLKFTDTLINKIIEISPKICVITTPILKPNGEMWDKQYHFKEYSIPEFKKLLDPLQEKYAVKILEDRPINQYGILEKHTLTKTEENK